jgi:hypothetical protein
MFNYKGKISSIMVAVVTTFMMFSSTSAGAFTSASSASLSLAAQTSVNTAQTILSTSAYDLIANQRIILKANTEIIVALKAISKLDSNSGLYKSLRARIAADLTRMMNAKKNIKTLIITEALAEKIADVAIKAVEIAPIVTTADLLAVKVLQTTALNAIANVKGSDMAKLFLERLRIATL